jgi:hypothetical protein
MYHFFFSFSAATITFPSSIINSDFSSPSQSAHCLPVLVAPQMKQNFSKRNFFNIIQSTRCSGVKREVLLLLLSSSESSNRARIAKIPSNFILNCYSLLIYLITAILLPFIYSTIHHIWLKFCLLLTKSSNKKFLKSSNKGFFYPISPIFMIPFLIIISTFIGTFANPSLTQSGSHSSFIPQSPWGNSQSYWSNGGSHQWPLHQQKSTREIMLSVVKNISEATPVGEILLNFRAEDKSSPTYNLT